ncbi:MAG: PQQ-binding-like beta-propeller repeat protein [Myxococcota bacterium]
MRCPTCSAVLTTDELRKDDCPYCGAALPHSVEAVSKAKIVREVMRDFDKDGDGVPELLPKRRPRTSKPRSKPRRSSKVRVALSVGLACLGAGAFALVQEGAGLGSSSAGSGIVLVVDACPVDANGDGVDDYAAVVQRGGAKRRWAILDGVTGEASAIGSQDVESLNRVFCLGRDWFAIGAPDFSIEFVNARAPEPTVRVRGADTLRAARGGEGCAWLETSNGTISGVTLPGGIATPCDASEATRVENTMGLTDNDANYVTSNRTFSITARRQGSEVLTVSSADQEGTPLWTEELPYAKPTFGTAIAATSDRVFLVGAPIGQDKAHLIALDASTGRQAFDVPVDYTGPDEGSLMFISGDQVVALVGWSFCAFDVTTGDTRWCIAP